MTWNPYVSLPDEAKEAVEKAAREEGYSTTAAYLRRVILSDAAETTGESLSQLTGVTTDE